MKTGRNGKRPYKALRSKTKQRKSELPVKFYFSMHMITGLHILHSNAVVHLTIWINKLPLLDVHLQTGLSKLQNRALQITFCLTMPVTNKRYIIGKQQKSNELC